MSVNYIYTDEVVANHYKCTGCGVRILFLDRVVKDDQGMFCKNCGKQIAEKGKITRNGECNKRKTESKS